MFERINTLICKFSSVLIPSPLLLIFRLYWGYQFFQAGLHKFQNISATAQSFSDLHIWMPAVNAYLVASIETAGGLLLMAGLYARLAALPLTIILIVAYFTAHHTAIENILIDPKNFLDQSPWNFLVTTLLVLGFGPGIFSIDALLNRRQEHYY